MLFVPSQTTGIRSRVQGTLHRELPRPESPDLAGLIRNYLEPDPLEPQRQFEDADACYGITHLLGVMGHDLKRPVKSRFEASSKDHTRQPELKILGVERMPPKPPFTVEENLQGIALCATDLPSSVAIRSATMKSARIGASSRVSALV